MPMSFPDMESLVQAAEVHKFRQLNEGETEAAYRTALADHVQGIDLVESMEIRTGKGWDQWDVDESRELVARGFEKSMGEAGFKR